jgi:hypothetical protein
VTPEERESLLAAATPRPWVVTEYDADGEHYEEVRPAARDAIIVFGEGCYLPPTEAANLRLVVAAVNEYEAHLDGEDLLRGVLDYFRGHDLERQDGRSSPVIPKIEDVLARLDAARSA